MKQKMSNKKFTAILSAVMAVLVVVALAASIVMPLLSSTMDTYLGRGERYTVQIEGADKWDTKYYDQKYTDTNSKTGSVSYGLQVSKQITDEGEVLLKNNGVLPLAKGTKVTPFGYRFLNPLYGGTGSGNVDASKDYIVTAEKGLVNFDVNSTMVEKLRAGKVIELTSDGANAVSTSKANLRRAMKNTAYAVANSNIMQGVAPGSITKYKTSPWMTLLIAGDIAVGVLVVAGIVWIALRRKSAKLHPENYKK